MVPTVLVLSVLTLFMLTGVLPSPGGMETGIFGTPVFVALLGFLAGLLAVCCARRRPTWRATGFLLTHAGVVVLLAGAFAGYVSGRRGQMAVPVLARHALDSVQTDKRETIPLGFKVAAADFAVSFYPPLFDLYAPPPGAPDAPASGFRLVRRLSVEGHDRLAITDGLSVPVSALRTAEPDGWTPHFALTNGWVLQIAPRTARHYEAQLVFTDRSGQEARRRLAVNHPVTHGGWRFYLVSYEAEPMRYVVLSARQDPGRPAVIAGIWMSIAGTAVLCLRKRRGGPSA